VSIALHHLFRFGRLGTGRERDGRSAVSRFAPGAGSRDAVTVTVHDGRSNRDDSAVDPKTSLGEVLARFQAATPFRVGDSLTLPDGSRWPVTAVRDRMSLSGAWSQIVTIGDAATP
jgi:hypothetical protein